MNHAENTQAAIAQNLKDEALTLLLKHFKVRNFEALFEAKSALDAFERATIRGVIYRPPVDLPWVTNMMQAAVMPDNTICMETIRNHAIRHGELMTIHTGPLEPSLELRKEMDATGYVWGYHGEPNEDDAEEQHYYAEVTGYGLAKFLGIDLNTYMVAQREALQQTA